MSSSQNFEDIFFQTREHMKTNFVITIRTTINQIQPLRVWDSYPSQAMDNGRPISRVD